MDLDLREPAVDLHVGRTARPSVAPAEPRTAPVDAKALERRGRAWLIWSFLACPCHLPLTLGFLGVVLGGTALGAVLRDNAWLAGGVITAVWAAGTARGLWLVRKGERGELACAVPNS
jgi:mercuric ion transport protein